MKRWLIYLILVLQCFAAAFASAQMQLPPKPAPGQGIYVQDYADILSPADEQKILSLGQELDNKTTAQLAVLTVSSLQGQPIDAYSLAVLRSWGIGNRDKNNGALIVIAVKDRQSRIEVGYGLEGILPDGLTGRIQDQSMIPYFKQGNYAAGIVSGYANTAAIIAKSAGVTLDGLTAYTGGAKQAPPQEEYPLWLKLLIGAGIVALLIVDNVFLGGMITQMLFFFLLRGRGGGGGGFGGGSGGGGGSSRHW